MTQIFVPRENVNDDSVIVTVVHCKSGDFVKKGQMIVEIETLKTNMVVESPEDGVITHKLVVGDEIGVGALLFSIGNADNKKASKPQENKVIKEGIKISNAAKQLANRLGVAIDGLGSGWITTEDVEKKAGLVRPHFNQKKIDNSNESVQLSLPFKKESFSKRKQAEAKNLQMGSHHATSSTIGIDIKIGRKRIVEPPFLFENNISDLIVFEGSRLLRKYPELNAAYIDSKTYGKYEEINFGWSFDTGANLKVLAIKNSDRLTLAGLHREVQRLLELYESGQTISMDLLTSSTVTISDLSKTDAAFILPLINGYQSMILGIAAKGKNEFSIYATFDHRISEGLTVTKFLTELKSRILSYYSDKEEIASLLCYACEKTMADEIALRNRGFIKITLPNGDAANLCRSCFDGW